MTTTINGLNCVQQNTSTQKCKNASTNTNKVQNPFEANKTDLPITNNTKETKTENQTQKRLIKLKAEIAKKEEALKECQKYLAQKEISWGDALSTLSDAELSIMKVSAGVCGASCVALAAFLAIPGAPLLILPIAGATAVGSLTTVGGLVLNDFSRQDTLTQEERKEAYQQKYNQITAEIEDLKRQLNELTM